MTFEEAINKSKEYGSEVDPILKNANWINLKGMFTPEQLRAIADEIESRYNNKE